MLHTVWFQLYDIQVKVNYWDTNQINDLQWLEMEEGVNTKEHEGTSLGGMELVYVLNVVVVTSLYKFVNTH